MNNLAYHIAQTIRHYCPNMWNAIEMSYAHLFRLRYKKALKTLPEEVRQIQAQTPYQIKPLSSISAEQLEAFFHQQPKEDFKWFQPHGFDAASLRRLQRNPAFLAYVICKEDTIVAYFFARCYAHGVSYIGRMVDHTNRGKGLATLACRISLGIGNHLGLTTLQSISPENLGSLKSSYKAFGMEKVKSLANGSDLYRCYAGNN